MTDFLVRLDEAGKGIVFEHRGGRPCTFACKYGCLDTGFSIVKRRPPILGAGDEVVRFCLCDAGRSMSAGYWFDQVYPPRSGGGQRVKSDRGEARFLEYLRDNVTEEFGLRSAVEELRRGYEKARSRKLQDLE